MPNMFLPSLFIIWAILLPKKMMSGLQLQILNGAALSIYLETDLVWALRRCHWFTLNTINRIVPKPLSCTPLCKASANAPDLSSKSTGPEPEVWGGQPWSGCVLGMEWQDGEQEHHGVVMWISSCLCWMLPKQHWEVSLWRKRRLSGVVSMDSPRGNHAWPI